jgi:small subunit ribosomal protein S4
MPQIVWLQTDFDALEGTVLHLPARSDINAPVNEQLIVELFSRL